MYALFVDTFMTKPKVYQKQILRLAQHGKICQMIGLVPFAELQRKNSIKRVIPLLLWRKDQFQ
jgi:hypothetical protein